MLHPDSFNPDFDTRLFKHYADRLKKAFDANYKSIRDGNTSNSNIDSRTTMSISGEKQIEEQPQEQVEGPLSGVDNTIPDIKQ